MQFFAIVVPLILILAAFIVSTVLTGKGKKVFQNGPKDKASYRTLLGSTVSIALIVAVGILIFTQIISLIINEATLSNSIFPAETPIF